MKTSHIFAFVLAAVASSAVFAQQTVYSISRFEPGVFSSKWGDPQVVEISTTSDDAVIVMKYPNSLYQKVWRKNMAVTPLMGSEDDLSQIVVAGGAPTSLVVGATWENEFTSPPSPSSRCPHSVTSKFLSEVTKITDDQVEVSQKGTWTSKCGDGTGQAHLVMSRDLSKVITFEVSSFWGSRQVSGTKISLK